MSKGKGAKEHRKRVQARNNRLKQQNQRVEKLRREFIMNLIKEEQEKGMFENNQTINPTDPTVEGPAI